MSTGSDFVMTLPLAIVQQVMAQYLIGEFKRPIRVVDCWVTEKGCMFGVEYVTEDKETAKSQGLSPFPSTLLPSMVTITRHEYDRLRQRDDAGVGQTVEPERGPLEPLQNLDGDFHRNIAHMLREYEEHNP